VIACVFLHNNSNFFSTSVYTPILDKCSSYKKGAFKCKDKEKRGKKINNGVVVKRKTLLES
jgi:hypothetical protein